MELIKMQIVFINIFFLIPTLLEYFLKKIEIFYFYNETLQIDTCVDINFLIMYFYILIIYYTINSGVYNFAIYQI